MCRRDTNDVLVRRFLDRYQLNLLALPGRRVRCGSVYIQEGKRLTSPGWLGDLVEPELQLDEPFPEPEMPDLCDEWSDSYSIEVGIGLLRGFLAALGVAPLIDELKISAKGSAARTIAFRFREVSRESLSPTQLAAALEGHRLRRSSGWTQKGNRYFAVAAVVRSRSLSIRGHDSQDSAVDLGAGLVTFADAKAKVKVKRESGHELVYAGDKPLAIAVELYELVWGEDGTQPAFHTQRGPLRVQGLADDARPDPAYPGEDGAVLIAPVETSGDSASSGFGWSA
jgi:hypothetical protein